ncbi:MAG: aminotransferase class V-fold PLP-dependent enzyme, partial [Flavobacteriaceae bacterium]|nr:aminotransferase class V-fold PLP-dependent enzyme [Flavobacteriaceae bacterium]
MEKREFIKNLGLIGVSPLIPREMLLNNSSNEIISFSKTDSDDDFWTKVRSHYDLHPDFINLESGYYNIIPKPTLENHIKHIKRVNLEGSFYMRSNRFKDKNEITSKLSEIVGCNSENLVITRNTTESLDLVISGFNWKKGDQAIYALQDYGAMQDMFEQISERHGVILQKISVPNHPKNDKEIVSIYESKINSSTKLILVSHMINITGHILPIKKICQ